MLTIRHLLNLSTFLLVFGIYRLICYPRVVDLLFVLNYVLVAI